MQLRFICSLVIFCILQKVAVGQEINNMLSYKNLNSDAYYRLNYENDFFSATDQFYTQGIHMEVVSPALKYFPLSKVLVHPKYTYTRYGLAAEHDGYTPSSLGSDNILYGDRPFAGCLCLKTFLIAIDPSKKQRFSTAVSTGIIGPGAGAMEMQRDIHRWLNNITPHGWEYQVHNDVILNYEVNYEKQIVAAANYFSWDLGTMARAGTLSDKAAVATTLMMGYFDSPYSNDIAGKSHFRIFAYEHPDISVIGYDATLQGGMFNRTSPYIIPQSQINRFVFQNRFGFVVSYKRIFLEYFQSVKSNEYATGKMHVWGGVQIAFSF